MWAEAYVAAMSNFGFVPSDVELFPFKLRNDLCFCLGTSDNWRADCYFAFMIREKYFWQIYSVPFFDLHMVYIDDVTLGYSVLFSGDANNCEHIQRLYQFGL